MTVMIRCLFTAAALTVASASAAQAATVFEVEGNSAGSTLLTGDFNYDGTTYSDWDLEFAAGSSVTAGFTFDTTTSSPGSTSGTGLELEGTNTTSGDEFTLALEFTDDLDTLAVGDTTDLVDGDVIFSPSLAFIGSRVERVNSTVPTVDQTQFLSGTVSASGTVAAVPVPASLPLMAGGLSILGLMGWRRRRAVRG